MSRTETIPPLTKANRLGYEFDPPPKFVLDLVCEKKLKRIDGDVLEMLLRFRRARRDSCWCAKSTIADKLGVTPRTVQSSLKRLAALGIIQQVEMDVPDPDDPRNRTGWRIYFLWMMPARISAPGPDRRRNDERRKVKAETDQENQIAPPQEQKISPPPETNISPKSVSSRQDGAIKTTAPLPPVRPSGSPEPSPSSLASLEGKEEPRHHKADGLPEPERLEAMAVRLMAVLAMVRTLTLATAKIREWVARYGPELVDQVLTLAELLKPTRNAVRKTGGIVYHLDRWKSWAPDAIGEELAALRPRPKPAAVLVIRSREPDPPPPNRAELLEMIATLEGKARRNGVEQQALDGARAELLRLDQAAGPDPEARPA
jgi:DNA-binding Lrp family transcriptional regulator